MARRNRGWVNEHRRDPFVKAAQRDGYRSRAAFKLRQLDDRDRLLGGARLVVDLGAAPGGWSQVAAERIRPGGRVIAVDLLEIPPLPGVEVVRGSLLDEAVRASVRERLGAEGADVVLSDMAPNLSGVRDVDRARGLDVAECARDFAFAVLRPGGSFVVKLFEGPDAAAFRASLEARFARTAMRKPGASRSRSAEVYLLAREFGEV